MVDGQHDTAGKRKGAASFGICHADRDFNGAPYGNVESLTEGSDDSHQDDSFERDFSRRTTCMGDNSG